MVTMARPVLGNETEAFGSDPSSDKVYRFRYKVLELDDLITSHKPDLTLNPRYPKELQPRIRDRAASRIQIEGMAQHLNPRVLLHDSGFIDTGPMIVGPDNVVESGNGRSLALMVAAKEAPENYSRYKSMLETLADKYGLTKSHISSMSRPVLVRERLTDLDRVKFATEANVGAVMGMSPYEQALQDSKKLSPEVVGQLEVGEDQTIDQALRSRGNDFIVQHFVSNVPANERATIADDKGQINSQGLQRLRLALFAKTYTGSAGEKLTRIFGESADPYVKQLETAMFSTLPDMAKAEGLISSGARDKELNVAPDIAEVVDTYASLKAQGLSVQDYLKQGAMFEERLTPFQKQLLEHLDDIGRKSKALREFFRETAEKIIASPPPGQGSLLGDARLSKEEVLNGIINRQREEIGKPRVAVAPALSHRKELAQADTPRTPGPIGVGSEVGSHVAKAPPPVPAGQPTLAPGASVQVGLAGIGPTHAQVKMLEEFGTAPGAGGQKQQLIDEEALKAKEEAKPLKGQMGFGGEVVGEESRPVLSKPAPSKVEPRGVLWGRREGEPWVKLTENTSNAEQARRRADGWEVTVREHGVHPEPPSTGKTIPYRKDLDIRNLDAVPRGTGARYLLTIKGMGEGELIAKGWKRTPPASLSSIEVLVDMGSKPPTAEEVVAEVGIDKLRLYGKALKAMPGSPRQKQIVEQIKELDEKEGEPTPRKVAYGSAANYIRTIRNDDKRHYASKYWNWVADGRPGDEPARGKISMMAAQAVRLKIDDIAKGLEEKGSEQIREGQIGATRIDKGTWDKMVKEAANTLKPHDAVREANDKALRYIRAIKNKDKQYYATLYWSYLSQLIAGYYGMTYPDHKRSGLSDVEAEAVRDKLTDIGKDIPRKAATVYVGPPQVKSHGQSFEHAQVHPTVVKIIDTPEEIAENYQKALRFEAQRPPLSREQDESMSHSNMVIAKRLTSKKLRSWRRRPGSCDIQDVDSRVARMPRLSR